tara:strand:+ start:45 stop:311 length:267 start_codon:yes stop_codon:yes gene_type:complete
MKLTSKEIKKYMLWRTDKELIHCPDCIAAACNDMAKEFSYNNAKDLMKLLFFNDPIPSLHTHNYGFHTATGRMLIEKLKDRYYEHKNN